MGLSTGTQTPTAVDLPALAETILDALDNASIGVSILLDRDGQLERGYANAAAARIMGVELAAVHTLPPLAPVAPDERPRMATLLAALRRGEPPPAVLETAFVHADGTRVSVEISLARAYHRGVPATVALLRDTSARTRIEEALRRSEARFRHLAEASPDTIVVISEGRVAYANPTAVRVLGFDSMADFVARPVRELVIEEERAMMGQRVGQVLQGGRFEPAEYHGRRKDGSLVVMEISSSATEFGGRPAVVAFGRDVSERKALHARLLQQDRLAAVGTLAAGVAHEINNPLTYVLLNLQRLGHMLDASFPPDRAEVRSALAEAKEGAERVRAIVRELLVFARPDADAHERVDVRAAVQSAIKLARAAAPGAADIVADVGVVPPVVTARGRLGQVLLNVIVNALQACAERGDGGGEVRITASSDGARVVVQVADDGPGIAPEHLRRVFDPFFTTKPPGAGTGLGLAVSHAIVQSLGGAMSAANAPGGGAVIRVELPVAPADTAVALAPSAPSVAAPRRLRVLVVDDEPTLAHALAASLANTHDVVTHMNARDALAALAAEPRYDVVVCDVLLPGLLGSELYARVCAARPEYAARFVFVTGGAVPARAAAAIAASGCAQLYKPFELREVDAAIRACAGGR